MPEVRSKNRLPSGSVTTEPMAWSITSGYSRVFEGLITRWSCATSALAFGPGTSHTSAGAAGCSGTRMKLLWDTKITFDEVSRGGGQGAEGGGYAS